MHELTAGRRKALAADGMIPDPFLMSTVDTDCAQLGAFARVFAALSRRESDADVTLAIIPTPDDDKPLLVRVFEDPARRESRRSETTSG